ncbi:hypothetical protein [Achromobacter spanius]|uniref:hypothetical protein n=1 Tax=Achromobacter spanius TaxID=217203 RepID=UPI003A9585B0
MTILKRMWKATEVDREGATDFARGGYANTIRPLAILFGLIALLAIFVWGIGTGVLLPLWRYLF